MKFIDKANYSDNAESAELTDRENQIMLEVKGGAPNKLIARKLDISESTVKKHLYNIFNKIGAKNRTHALTLLSRH